MNFEEAVEWLYSFQKYGIKLGLDRIKYISKKLGKPEKNYNTIHIGGTNGKGSVCKILESIFVCNGNNVGVYTSPHLQHITERITVNKKNITNNELVKLVEKIKPIVEDMVKQGNTPTFFEVFTAIAFEYFSEKKVDFAIVEVGLGGRFDATNIISPEVSIITNVTLEHQNILGEKVEDIAFEKAGIIKENIPVVTAATGKALGVVEKISKEKNSQIKKIGKTNWKRTKNDNICQEFIYKDLNEEYSVSTTLIGKHQGENIALAIGAIEFLLDQGYEISKKNIIEGVRFTVNKGRMEIVSYNPCILLDGAHNIAGMNLLSDTLKNDFKFDKLILILGILSDKNIIEMLPNILGLADIVIATKSNNERACDPVELKNIIRKLDNKKEIVVEEKIRNAIDYAKSKSCKNDFICITGSLFTVGEARDFLVNNLQKC